VTEIMRLSEPKECTGKSEKRSKIRINGRKDITPTGDNLEGRVWG
jgi:hypothetical protein